ncbi:MAG: carboxylesterase family protein, partial [Clostridia bacterium]|nr:carboxylesterase family protein [Clostridia bacterium]
MSKYYKQKTEKIIADGTELALLVLSPVKNARPKDKTPGILWIHGGGYVTGMAKMIYMSRAIHLV